MLFLCFSAKTGKYATSDFGSIGCDYSVYECVSVLYISNPNFWFFSTHIFKITYLHKVIDFHFEFSK